MSVSDVITYGLTRRKLINKALSKIGVKSIGQELSAEEFEIADETLTMLLMHYQGKGINIWLSDLVTLYLEEGKHTYKLGDASAKAAVAPSETTLAAATVASSADITVTNNAGFVVNGTVGIYGSAGWFWATISGVAGTVITLSQPLTSVIAAGSTVVTFEKGISRPSRVKKVWRLHKTGGNTPVNVSALDDFFHLYDNATQGEPNQYYYKRPDLAENNYGLLYLYPTPPKGVNRLLLHVQRGAGLPQNNSETLDMPQEMQLAFTYILAAAVAPDFHKAEIAKANGVYDLAERYERDMRSMDREQDATVTFGETY